MSQTPLEDAGEDIVESSEIDRDASITVKQVGGIDRCTVTLSPGVTVLTGRNATNRTSFMTAIADVLGGSPATIKSDADQGRIELTLGDESYVREYARQNGGLASNGERYSDQRDLVDLFVRLLEDNQLRRAVERGDDLREILMRPVDTDRIQREIRDREQERARIDDRLDEIERESDRLPTLKQRQASLEADLGDVEEELASVQRTVAEYEASEEEAEQAEALFEELETLQQQIQQTETKIGNREEELDRLHEERAEVDAALEELSVPDSELETVEAELETLQQEKRDIESTVDTLTRIISFNDEFVSGDPPDFVDDTDSEDVTAALDPMSETVECWTCGSQVERQAFADQLDELRDVVSDYRAQRNELTEEIEELEEQQHEIRRHVEKQEELESRLDELERQIEFQESEIAELEETRDDLRSERAAVEERVEETEELRESDLVEAYQRLSELEYERGKVEQEIEDLEDEIAEIDALTEERGQLEAQRDEVMDELASLRSRIGDIEQAVVEQFNTHMDEILGLLGYENVSRVWIERKMSEGRRDDATFDLHVVRESDDGAVYEDTVGNLSASEREVIGLVVALAGYLVHEVYERIPFMLLDALEAIDAPRIAALVDYFAEYVPFLIVALLPEDADTLPDEYDRVPASALGD